MKTPLPQIGLPCHMHHPMRKIVSWRLFESIWDKSQQVDPATNKDYWDRAYGNTYYNPAFGGVYSARSSYSEIPFMGTQDNAHPLGCLPWILMHKEVQVLQVDTTMVPYLAQSIHMRECRLTFLHSHHHHPLCLRVSLCHCLKMMMKKNHEQMSKNPQDLFG
jgi:hypothetical protein